MYTLVRSFIVLCCTKDSKCLWYSFVPKTNGGIGQNLWQRKTKLPKAKVWWAIRGLQCLQNRISNKGKPKSNRYISSSRLLLQYLMKHILKRGCIYSKRKASDILIYRLPLLCFMLFDFTFDRGLDFRGFFICSSGDVCINFGSS